MHEFHDEFWKIPILALVKSTQYEKSFAFFLQRNELSYHLTLKHTLKKKIFSEIAILKLVLYRLEKKKWCQTLIMRL